MKLTNTGAVDFAQAPPAYTPAETPLSQLVNAARIPTDTAVAMRGGIELFWHTPGVSDLIEAEMKANNVMMLQWYPMEYGLLSTGKPITTLAELDGVRLRSVGIFEPKLMESYGAIPVVVMPAEWYESLARGTIDAFPMVTEAIMSFKLYEVSDYLTFHCGAIMSNMDVINLDVYNKLPDVAKALLIDDAFRREASEMSIKIWREEADASYAEMAKHLTIVKPDPAEQQQLWDDWKKVTIEEYPKALAKMGKEAEALKVIDAWLELTTDNDLAYWDKKFGITR